uniref:Serine hydrolase-like protein 2 isoform X1 n=1 Tax=Pogona vitticeps TaxID=103695 RepID=A0A6J0T4K0_9SAUR
MIFCSFISGTVSELQFLVPWGHIAAKAWGSPKGRPVLCLHGWLDNANTFNKLIPLLPRDCYYMAIDLGGHGLSSHRPVGSLYYLMDYVGDVRRVTAALKWNRFTLMGHSMGGTVAGMFSCVFPELVEKLILVESYGFYPAAKESEKILLFKRAMIEHLLKTEANSLLSPKVYTPEAALQRLLEANRSLTEESGKILLERGTAEVPGGLVFTRDLRIHMNVYGYTSADEPVNYLRKIQADILMIISQNGLFKKDSDVFRADFFMRIHQGYKTFLKEHFNLVSVPGNHYVHLNEPEVVAGIISTFLTKDHSLKARL